MSQLIQAVVTSEERQTLQELINDLRSRNQLYWLRNDILNILNQGEQASKLSIVNPASLWGQFIDQIQEILLQPDSFYLVIRANIGSREIWQVTKDFSYQPIRNQDFLALQDQLVNRHHPENGDILELDFTPFYDYSPRIKDAKNIGKGGQFLTEFLTSNLWQNQEEWLVKLFELLSQHSNNKLKLFLNQRIQSYSQLSAQVKKAITWIRQIPATQAYEQFPLELQELGFEPGWGNTAGRVLETLELLDELIDSPQDQVLETFLSRLPLICRIAIISIHGWFAQEGVLGRPDTGGQIVYILDQVRGLEQQLKEDLNQSGLASYDIHPQIIILTRLIPNSDGTRCDQRLEKVKGTDHSYILRVPFRSFNPQRTDYWMSRFEIWPYLETYSLDAEVELLQEFQGKPDLIIGNYSDGNLVAFLLARRLNVLQCNIAHALEKSKYLQSDLYWQAQEETYHFSLQFTADLIAMNAADLIITSTDQEIAGTPTSLGQYESYACFTMPDLYHVVSGIDLLSPQFNVVPPGVNETVFFPYTRTAERPSGAGERLAELLFTLEEPTQVWGHLSDPYKRPLFSMARLDRIKNLTGLAECFGRCPALQERCNLILVAGKLRVEDSNDYEEAEEIKKLYRIIEQYQLQGKIRWLGVRLSKTDSGEIYRVIADHQGIFVQPALFEAFGLTILESMISGVPTFGTQFGGPLEIIQDQVNGFYIDPTHLENMATKLLNFVIACDQNPATWQQISQAGIERVYSTYTWKIHTTRLLSLARIYGFWHHAVQDNRKDLLRYLEALFYLIYQPKAQELLAQHLKH